MFMETGNMIVIWVLVILAVIGGSLYMLVKYRRVSALNTAIKQKDYEAILSLSTQEHYRKMLGVLTCDLYRFNALRSLERMEELKAELNQAIEQYSSSDLEKLLELYYHYFLNKGDLEYAQKLLEDIRGCANEPFILCSEWSYQVIAQGRCDLFNEMEDAVNENTFKGFSLGTVLYLMGLQLEKEGDLEQAKGYYETSMQCFLPTAIYMTLCKRHIDAIDDALDEQDKDVEEALD